MVDLTLEDYYNTTLLVLQKDFPEQLEEKMEEVKVLVFDIIKKNYDYLDIYGEISETGVESLKNINIETRKKSSTGCKRISKSVRGGPKIMRQKRVSGKIIYENIETKDNEAVNIELKLLELLEIKDTYNINIKLLRIYWISLFRKYTSLHKKAKKKLEEKNKQKIFEKIISSYPKHKELIGSFNYDAYKGFLEAIDFMDNL